MYALILLLALAAVASGFQRCPRVLATSWRSTSASTQLRMSDAGENPAIDAIRQKMAADKDYNPMSDPQAMQVLEGLIPQEMKDIPNAIERLKVAFKDATEGTDALADIDGAAAGFTDKKSLISSPTSDWMKGGMTAAGYDESKKNDLKDKVQKANPGVPME